MAGNSAQTEEGSYWILVNKMETMLECLEPPLSRDCCIFRVSEKLRKVNEGAYTPSAVSIGPFHYGRKELETMEKQKPRYLDKFIRLTKKTLVDLVCKVKQLETSIRSCYAETFPHIGSDEFVKMILLDAAFIIVLFCRNHHPLEDDKDKLMMENLSLKSSVEGDLVLLENQIPFFVLESLYSLGFPQRPASENPSFLELSCKYFEEYNRQGKFVFKTKHFADLVRCFHLRSDAYPLLSSRPDRRGKITNLHCASELYEAGVRFVKSDSNCLLDVSFCEKGVLQMAQIVFEDQTESVIRNLMALEQCNYPNETSICDYITLLDYLINTTEDVDLLIQNKIIDNGLGNNDEVVTLVNKLGSHITVDLDVNYYSNICAELDKYYEQSWHKWKATLMHQYFSSPWRSASTIAAVILLVLTFIETAVSFIKN